MASPRRILPGTRYMITRRCCQRTFRLRPSVLTNQIFRYCIAYAAAQTGVVIHAVCVMSNHHHIVLTDVDGQLPVFTRELHRLTAKAMNASQGQWENLWSAEHCHVLELGDDNDLLAKIAYVGANPTAAGLVHGPEDWPGVLCLAGDDVHVERVARPSAYFGDASRCPKQVELRIAPPTDVIDFAARLASVLGRALEAARQEMRERGWGFLGRAAVMATSFAKRATSFERKRQIVPRVAARSMFLRGALLDSIRDFRRAYHAAIERWRAGVRSLEFPDGTWWMRVFHGVGIAGSAARAAA